MQICKVIYKANNSQISRTECKSTNTWFDCIRFQVTRNWCKDIFSRIWQVERVNSKNFSSSELLDQWKTDFK